MKTTMTIEQLAEKMNQKVWSKGDLKRIYLNNEGWNTKKMSTKTYIWQNEKGEFIVNCRIECPSQSYNWIDSQEQQVIDSVNRRIERILFNAENPDMDYEEYLEEKAIEEKTVKLTAEQEEIANLNIDNVGDYIRKQGYIFYHRKEETLWNMYLNYSQFTTQSRFLNEKDDYPPIIYDYAFERVFLRKTRHADQPFSEPLGDVKVGETTLNFEDVVDFVYVGKRGTNGPNKKNVFKVIDIPQHITDALNAQLEIEKSNRIEHLKGEVEKYRNRLIESIEIYKASKLK